MTKGDLKYVPLMPKGQKPRKNSSDEANDQNPSQVAPPAVKKVTKRKFVEDKEDD